MVDALDLVALLAPSEPGRTVTGTVVGVPASGRASVDIGDRVITVTAPDSIPLAEGATVRVAVLPDNVAIIESVLDVEVVPVGVVLPYLGSTGHLGWLLWDNALTFSAATYPRLYALLGTTSLPDPRDCVLMGKSGTKTLRSTGGATTVTLAGANIPPHYHATGFTGATIREPATGTNITVATTATPGNNTQTDTGTPTAFSIIPKYVATNFLIRAA